MADVNCNVKNVRRFHFGATSDVPAFKVRLFTEISVKAKVQNIV